MPTSPQTGGTLNEWYSYPISHGYYANYDPSIGDTTHFAVDIATPQDTPFYFPVSGTVEQADYAVWNGKSGGGEVFIRPDTANLPGFSSGSPLTDEEYVYHLDQIFVQPGQHVYAGQTVGLTGGQNTGGQHPTDPMWSSGPHAHFGYFEKYESTPVGNRPYGPDPTSLIQALNTEALSQQQIYQDATQPLNPTQQSWLQQLQQDIGANTQAATRQTGLDNVGNAFNSIGNAFSFLQNGGLVRVGLFAIGGLVALGGILIVSKQ